MWLSPLHKHSNSLLSFSTRAMSAKPSNFFPTIPQGYKLKRFYKKVEIMEHPLSDEVQKLQKDEQVSFHNLSQSDTYWTVTLDGKSTKTMFKDTLLIPTKALAIALAEEWEMQHENINLRSLHLVNLIIPFELILICFNRITTWLKQLEPTTTPLFKVT